MKSSLLIIAVAFSFLAVSCKKDSTNNSASPSPDVPAQQTNVIKAKVNGVMKEATEVSSWLEDGQFNLYAANGMNFGWIIGFQKNVSVGQTLTIDENNPQAAIFFTDVQSDISYSSITGQVSITVKDTVAKKIGGTFNCELYNDDGNVTATEGYFNVSYVVIE